MMIKRKNTKICPFRKEYARSGNRGLKKYGMGNRLLGVTAVFFVEIMYLGNNAEKTEIRQMGK